MYSIRIGQQKLYEWTHDTYTKVSRCKTWKNWPMMYTWTVKNAIDLAEQFRVLGLLRNNIFLDKAYELSTYLSKAYWSNKKNHDKLRDPWKNVLKSFVPKVVPQPWMPPRALLRHAPKCQIVNVVVFKFFVLSFGRSTESKMCYGGPRS